MKQIRKILFLLLSVTGFVRGQTYPFTTIDTPGFYKLASNVTNQITISASDVTLDMNGGTVSGGSNGIVIMGGLHNVTIKNGTISSVSSDGIQINAGCSAIKLNDISVSQALIGINCEHVTNALIYHCDMQESTTGFLLDSCANIVLQECTAVANTHAGYDLLASTTCNLIACQAVSTGDGNSDIDFTTVFGFVCSNGNGNIFERCIANATQALSVTDSNSLIAGFALRGSESCTQIIDSESCNTETNVHGVTVPYGILFEGTLDSTMSVTGALATDGGVRSMDWSPDGKYLAAGGDGLTGGIGVELQIFSFDRAQGVLTSVAEALGEEGVVFSVSWSSDGQYIAVGGAGLTGGTGDELQVFSFDRAQVVLTSIAGALGTAGDVFSVSWSPDGLYVAAGGSGLTDGTGDELQVFSFDKTEGILTSVTGALGTAGTVRSVSWSPDGQYIAVGGDGLTGGTGDDLQIFSFDRIAGALTSVAGALDGFVFSVSWSPDGLYIAVGGNGLTGGTGDQFQIVSFDRLAGVITPVAGALGVDADIRAVEWSPDGLYIAVGGGDILGDDLQIFSFDRGAGIVVSRAEALALEGEGSSIEGISWSPDGENFAVGGFDLPENNLQIFTGLQFPKNNVIKGNTVYCNSGGQSPSGVGISAPSISNMVIGNTAFNNPIPRGANEPIVSSNYQFVTNVFDQLFGEFPSVTQNIATDALTPQFPIPDIPGRIKRAELLLESLIDNLL